MDQLTQIGLSIRLWLASIHPVAPWVALAAAFWLVDAAADRFGLTAALERKLPFGKLLARTIDTLPVVVLGAAWANIASGDAALDSAVLGAVAAALRPVYLAAKEWILGTEKTPPADGGPSAGPMLALLLVGLSSVPFLTGCLTKQERDCKTAFEVVEAVDIAVNCVPLDGAAYDACIDKTMDHYDPLVLSCVKDGAS